MIAMSANDDILIRLGTRVRHIRTQRGYTQEQLAEECDFDRTYISLIERGRRNPSFTNLMKLASGLDVSVSDLTDGI